MPSHRPKVVVTRRLPAPVEARMVELFDTRLNADDRPLTQQELVAAVSEADVLVPTLGDRVDAEIIRAAGDRLRLLANFGAGLDHIDLPSARARGIVVTNTPGALTEDTADIALALILGVSRRLGEGEALLRRGDWRGWAPTDLLGRKLAGKTLGIVGMGRIGRALARRARACGLSIHYHNRRRLAPEAEAEFGAAYRPDLDDMLGEVDILSLNCPATPETRGLIDRRRLDRMKEEAFIINTARGDVVDEDALIRALQEGKIAGAGLDVYVGEPHVDPRLLGLPNVVLLPHMGSATLETRTAMGDKVIANIIAWSRGETPPDLC